VSNSKSQSNSYVSEDKLMLRLDNILYEYYQDNGNQLLLNHIVLYNLSLDVREGEFVTPRVTPRPRNIDHPLIEYITKEIVAESEGQFPIITNTTTTTNNNKRTREPEKKKMSQGIRQRLKKKKRKTGQR